MKSLLISPRFPYSFWSMDTVCTIRNRSALVPPLGLITVASYLPHDWEVRLVDLNVGELTESDWEWADVVLVSAMLIQREGMLDLIRECKSRGKQVVAGGPYVSSLPDEALAAGCDYVVKGEGEEVVRQVVESIGHLPAPRVFHASSRPDMTRSACPRFELLDFTKYLSVGIQTSRGCPHNCEFCDIVNLFGVRPRYKAPEQVVNELESLYRLGWRGDVFLTDDNFIGNKTHAKSILEKLIPWSKDHGEPFSFTAQTSVDLGRDVELIDMMTEANFDKVFIGLETPDREALAKAGKLQNVRHSMAESVIAIRDNGLSVLGSFIIGLDGERPGAGRRICEFVEETAIPMVSLNKLIVLPNTALWHRLKREERLLSDVPADDSVLDPLRFVPSRPAAEIEAEFVDSWNYLYEHSRYLDRVYRYFLSMRSTRTALGLVSPARPQATGNGDKPPFREQLAEIRALPRILARLVISRRLASRLWAHLRGMRKHNPSRIRRYLQFVFIGEDLFRVRDMVNARNTPTGAGQGPAPAAHHPSAPIPPTAGGKAP